MSVRREWGVQWLDTGHVAAQRSEQEAREVAAIWSKHCEVVSRWVRESPWKAD